MRAWAPTHRASMSDIRGWETHAGMLERPPTSHTVSGTALAAFQHSVVILCQLNNARTYRDPMEPPIDEGTHILDIVV